MIAIEGPDSVYGRCLSLAENPTGNINAPGVRRSLGIQPTVTPRISICLIPTRAEPGRGRRYSDQLVDDVAGGGFNLNSVMNYNMASETQDRADLPTLDWAGTTGCALQIQCQGYEYRIFTTLNYFRGPGACR